MTRQEQVARLNPGRRPDVSSPPAIPDGVLFDVQAILAAAWEKLATAGWRCGAHSCTHQCTPDGVRLVDALNYASASLAGDRRTHLLAFACAAMAIERHTGRPAHELLPDRLADIYLCDKSSDERLHRLDASIMTRYNADVCGGYEDARTLIMIAYENAREIVAEQMRANR